MANRSSYAMETNQKSSRQNTNRRQHSNHKQSDYYDSYESRSKSYDKKDKYQSWKRQTQDDSWDD